MKEEKLILWSAGWRGKHSGFGELKKRHEEQGTKFLDGSV